MGTVRLTFLKNFCEKKHFLPCNTFRDHHLLIDCSYVTQVYNNVFLFEMGKVFISKKILIMQFP